jgi:hypothetical protein
MTAGNRNDCLLCVGREKAAEHLLFPGPFCFFLGRCQKENKLKAVIAKAKRFFYTCSA